MRVSLSAGLLSLWDSSLMSFHPGKRPWLLVKQADIALPSATQNEVSEEEAKGLVAAGVRIVAEGSNMVRLFVNTPVGQSTDRR